MRRDAHGDVFRGAGLDLLPETVPLEGRHVARDPLVLRTAQPGVADDIGVALVVDLLPHIEIAELEGVGRCEDHPLARIVFDNGGQVRGQRAIVGEIGAEPVGHGERPLAHAGEQPRHTVTAVAVEGHGVDERRGHAAQDDIDPLHARDGFEIEPAVEHDEIVALHDGHTHLARERGVVEVMVVAAAAREQHAARHALRLADEFLEHVEHLGGEILHGQDFVAVEEARCDLAHDLAFFERVARALRHAELFPDDHPAAAGVALQVERAELEIGHRGAGQPGAAAMEIRIGVDGLVGHNTGLEDFLAPVDVVQERIPSPHALAQALLDAGPFLAADDHGHEIELGRAGGLGLDLAAGEVGAVLLVQLVGQGKDAVEMLRRHGAELVLKSMDHRGRRRFVLSDGSGGA
jgi:hypothetical protein